MQESDFGKYFTAWLEDHAFVSINKYQLSDCIALAEQGARAVEILRRLANEEDMEYVSDETNVFLGPYGCKWPECPTMGEIREVLDGK